jgi:hypothetical protein
MSDDILPADQFSRRRRELADNPGAVHTTGAVTRSDLYGNVEDWLLETFRVDGVETVFMRVNDREGGRRLMLPPEVAGLLYRQREQLVAKGRKRAARQAVATKLAKGQVLGNAAALRKARRAKKGGRG